MAFHDKGPRTPTPSVDLFSWAPPGKSLIIFLIHHPHNLIKLKLKTLSLSRAHSHSTLGSIPNRL
jgi:hypothetical protein